MTQPMSGASLFKDRIASMHPVLRRFVCQAFVVYVASNMAVCAIVFAPWALPRETVSGLLGRWKTAGGPWQRRFAIVGSWVVDRIYFWEPNHCVVVFRCERDARLVLYPEKPGAKP